VLQEGTATEAFRLGRAPLREGVTVLAASRATEPSAGSVRRGAFTRILLDGLDGDASDHLGQVTTLSLYGYISRSFGAWQQRPTFKAHLTEPTLLRVGPPWLDPALLRQLPDHFATADTRLQLTPAHEGEGRPLPSEDAGTFEQRQFDYLGRLRNANLVTSDADQTLAFCVLAAGGRIDAVIPAHGYRSTMSGQDQKSYDHLLALAGNIIELSHAAPSEAERAARKSALTRPRCRCTGYGAMSANARHKVVVSAIASRHAFSVSINRFGQC
jgi:hypothetical protein